MQTLTENQKTVLEIISYIKQIPPQHFLYDHNGHPYIERDWLLENIYLNFIEDAEN